MTVWVCSDLHLNHFKILEYYPTRNQGKLVPDVDSMNELIISNWNSVVDIDDSVYILGDVAMGKIDKAPPLIRRLNGHKYLIRGNHDKSLSKLIKNSDTMEFADLFVWIKDVYVLPYKLDDKKYNIFMSHYPHIFWAGSGSGTLMFHGHCHCDNGLHIGKGPIIDVGIDGNNLFPRKIDDGIALALKHAKKNPL